MNVVVFCWEQLVVCNPVYFLPFTRIKRSARIRGSHAYTEPVGLTGCLRNVLHKGLYERQEKATVFGEASDIAPQLLLKNTWMALDFEDKTKDMRPKINK